MEECKRREKALSNAIYVYNAYNDEKRTNHCIRLKPSIHKIIKRYCGNVSVGLGQFYEEAAFLFMDLNPPSSDFILVPVIEKTEKLFEDELEEIILIEELSTEMKNLTLGKKTYIGKKKRLLRLLKRCQKIDIRGERLEKLIKEAMSYITQPDV